MRRASESTQNIKDGERVVPKTTEIVPVVENGAGPSNLNVFKNPGTNQIDSISGPRGLAKRRATTTAVSTSKEPSKDYRRASSPTPERSADQLLSEQQEEHPYSLSPILSPSVASSLFDHSIGADFEPFHTHSQRHSSVAATSMRYFYVHFNELTCLLGDHFCG